MRNMHLETNFNTIIEILCSVHHSPKYYKLDDIQD